MTTFLMVIATLLLISLIVALIRVELGPTPADRMIAAQLFGTTGVAILLLLAEVMDAPAFRDVALVFALLAAMASVAFVKRAWHLLPSREKEGENRAGN